MQPATALPHLLSLTSSYCSLLIVGRCLHRHLPWCRSCCGRTRRGGTTEQKQQKPQKVVVYNILACWLLNFVPNITTILHTTTIQYQSRNSHLVIQDQPTHRPTGLRIFINHRIMDKRTKDGLYWISLGGRSLGNNNRMESFHRRARQTVNLLLFNRKSASWRNTKLQIVEYSSSF